MAWNELQAGLFHHGVSVVPVPSNHSLWWSELVNVRSRDSQGRARLPTVVQHTLESAAQVMANPAPPGLRREREQAHEWARDLVLACERLSRGEQLTSAERSRPEIVEAYSHWRRLPIEQRGGLAAFDSIRARHSWLRLLKLSVAAFAPTVFRGEPLVQNALHTSMATFDYDDGTTIEQVETALDGQVRGFIHTTLSHRPDSHRFRLLLPLAAPVDGRVHIQPLLRQVGALLPGCPDPAAMTAVHRFLLPYRLREDGTYRAVRLGDRDAGLLHLTSAEALLRRPMSIRRFEPTRGPTPRFSRQQRLQLCEELEGRVVANGTTAKGVPCPACGDRSAWFSLEVERGPRAFCNHRRTCGWRGYIHEL